MEKKYKLISNPSIARCLLKKGHQIYDIKIDKYRENGTVFLFEVTEKLLIDLSVIEK